MPKDRNRNITIMALLLVSAILLGSAVLIYDRPVLTSAVEPPVSTSSDYTFGIDISHYQGFVDWSKLADSPKQVHFVFMRATMGNNKKDSQFKRNWKEAGDKGLVRGAYHYFRPSINSEKQFKNYSTHVDLNTGDFPPILDIEELNHQGVDNTRRAVKNWLRLAEEHYGVKPIIYTGRKFYKDYLEGHVDGYTLWIASYSSDPQMNKIGWTFHQFSDRLRIQGIRANVDGNNFKGDVSKLKGMCIN